MLPMRSSMKSRIKMHDPEVVASNDRVRANVEQLMEMHGINQVELVARVAKSQPWLSKRMTGQTPFRMSDLDLLAEVFGLSPWQLLQEGYGKLDRRGGAERRCGTDRRRLGERFGNKRTGDHEGGSAGSTPIRHR